MSSAPDPCRNVILCTTREFPNVRAMTSASSTIATESAPVRSVTVFR
ncbi:Uncharacterised protein [Mycobacteroides abscessus subsp. abscessus]|nr:Uncharacterised protein [Mycobacteroides abscessus subsp. abscessus]